MGAAIFETNVINAGKDIYAGEHHEWLERKPMQGSGINGENGHLCGGVPSIGKKDIYNGKTSMG
jgi:hypothetical protein